MSDQNKSSDGRKLAGFASVPVEIAVRVGGFRTTLARLSELQPGDRIPLNRAIGEPFELLAQGRAIGRVDPVACEEHTTLKLVGALEDDDDER